MKKILISALFCAMFSGAAKASDVPYSKEFFFKDATGDNVLLITRGPILSNKAKSDSDGARSQEIHASRYLNYELKDGGIQRQLIWRINDGVYDCPNYTGLELDFEQKGIRITDLDNNGLSEVWVTYIFACQGGVDPASMKIIMYEGKRKYALRGNTKVCVNEEEYMGGDYKVDDALAQKPIFKKYAEDLWKELNAPMINGVSCKKEARFN